jgi:hypothetical protein
VNIGLAFFRANARTLAFLEQWLRAHSPEAFDQAEFDSQLRDDSCCDAAGGGGGSGGGSGGGGWVPPALTWSESHTLSMVCHCSTQFLHDMQGAWTTTCLRGAMGSMFRVRRW